MSGRSKTQPPARTGRGTPRFAHATASAVEEPFVLTTSPRVLRPPTLATSTTSTTTPRAGFDADHKYDATAAVPAAQDALATFAASMLQSVTPNEFGLVKRNFAADRAKNSYGLVFPGMDAMDFTFAFPPPKTAARDLEPRLAAGEAALRATTPRIFRRAGSASYRPFAGITSRPARGGGGGRQALAYIAVPQPSARAYGEPVLNVMYAMSYYGRPAKPKTAKPTNATNAAAAATANVAPTATTDVKASTVSVADAPPPLIASSPSTDAGHSSENASTTGSSQGTGADQFDPCVAIPADVALGVWRRLFRRGHGVTLAYPNVLRRCAELGPVDASADCVSSSLDVTWAVMVEDQVRAILPVRLLRLHFEQDHINKQKQASALRGKQYVGQLLGLTGTPKRGLIMSKSAFMNFRFAAGPASAHTFANMCATAAAAQAPAAPPQPFVVPAVAPRASAISATA